MHMKRCPNNLDFLSTREFLCCKFDSVLLTSLNVLRESYVIAASETLLSSQPVKKKKSRQT